MRSGTRGARRDRVPAGGAIRVALVGFAPYPWAQDLNDHAAARRLVREADGHADVVVVTMHAGAEGSDRSSTPRSTEYFLGENRGNVRAFAHAVVDAGADLVAGHGPHVLRGMEWYRGRLIAYSLGNFAGYKVFALSGPSRGLRRAPRALRGDGRFVRGKLVATRLTADGTPALDPSGRAHALVRTHSRADFGRHAASRALFSAASATRQTGVARLSNNPRPRASSHQTWATTCARSISRRCSRSSRRWC